MKDILFAMKIQSLIISALVSCASVAIATEIIGGYATSWRMVVMFGNLVILAVNLSFLVGRKHTTSKAE